MNGFNLLIKRVLAPVDKQLDKLTSYKLVLYFLYVLVAWGLLGSLFKKVGFQWYDILLSVIVLAVVCRGINMLVSKFMNIPRNVESDLITALILALILSPGSSLNDYLILAIAAAVAMLSKYILTISRWHIFNPAALGAFVSSEVFHHYASWWVGTSFITPVVFVGGMLVLRKMKRFIMAGTFEVVALAAIALETYLNQSAGQIWHSLWIAIISAPLLFFAYIMLTEPFTSPRHLPNYVPYAILVGFLYGYTKLKISPEEALLIGNIFAYIMEPNRRLTLQFVRKIPEAVGITSYIFSGKDRFKYQAGQYMEWTLSENATDFRGNRRYLTISSSPTEKDLMFTVRQPEQKSSRFKERINNFKKGDRILADGLAGTFTLPKSDSQKLAFLAGGVGITPFRSMVKYVVDFGQKRDIHLLYSAGSKDEFAFKDVFEQARSFGLQTTYSAETIDKGTIQNAIPDFAQRTFYISGPYGFVHSMEKALLQLRVPTKQIKTDFFPGYGA